MHPGDLKYLNTRERLKVEGEVAGKYQKLMEK